MEEISENPEIPWNREDLEKILRKVSQGEKRTLHLYSSLDQKYVRNEFKKLLQRWEKAKKEKTKKEIEKEIEVLSRMSKNLHHEKISKVFKWGTVLTPPMTEKEIPEATDWLLQALSIKQYNQHEKSQYYSPTKYIEAKILTEKTLYFQADKKLREDMKDSKQYEMFEDTLKNLDLQREISEHTYEYNISEALEVINKEKTQMYEQIKNELSYKHLLDSFMILEMQKGQEEKPLPNELEETFENIQKQSPNSKRSEFLWLQIQYNYALYSKAPDSQIFQERIQNLLNENPWLMNHYPYFKNQLRDQIK